MKRSFKVLLIIAISAAVVFPFSTQAWNAGGWLTAEQPLKRETWRLDTLAVLAEEAAAKAQEYAKKAYEHVEETFLIRSEKDAIQVALDKKSLARSELVSAQNVYASSVEASRAAAEAKAKYLNQEDISNMCKTSQTTRNIGEAHNAMVDRAKSFTDASVTKERHSRNPDILLKEVLDEHGQKYCSEDDVKRKRCSTPAPETEQNAETNAASLLFPANGTTYTEAEDEAARQHINLLVNPFPVAQLPKSLEKTPVGKEYNLVKMTQSTQLSYAYNSLMRIWSSMSVDGDLGDLSSNPEERLSMLGFMKKFSEDKFSDPEHWKSLVATDTDGLWREIALLMAGKNWMEFQMYLQAERIQSLVAIELANTAEKYNKERSGAIRQVAIKR